MKYLIVQDWSNTRGNHSGMEHMCDMLVERYPQKYMKYVNPEEKRSPIPRNRLLRKIRKLYDGYYYNHGYVNRYKRICKEMLSEIKYGDEVFLLEYMFDSVPQYGFAIYLRKKYPWLKLYALSHLSPSFLECIGFDKTKILEWSMPIDKMLTLGSSLSSYFMECGVPIEKISTGFHYVDNDYYQSSLLYPTQEKPLRVLCIGAVQRNTMLMADIIKNIPQVDWIVCRGNDKRNDNLFAGKNNVHLKGYLAENDLREVMETCDISLNVMDDTIGSNVITTSMAMGLALVVSDVGSIRDYCDERNAVFCQNTKESFVKGIMSIINDREKVFQMRSNSLEMSKRLNIENVDKWFSNLA